MLFSNNMDANSNTPCLRWQRDTIVRLIRVGPEKVSQEGEGCIRYNSTSRVFNHVTTLFFFREKSPKDRSGVEG